MKHISLILSIALLATSLQAAPRSVNEARLLATQFLQTQLGTTEQSIQLDQTSSAVYAPSRKVMDESTPSYYTFRDNQNACFVVVSGSTLTPSILAYGSDDMLSDTDSADLPAGLIWWFNAIDERITQIEQNPGMMTIAERAPMTEVQPLLDGIRWNQNAPFNNSCPVISGSNCPTGCVATAMAQIIRYYKNPSTGKGSHNYVWEYSENGKQKSKSISLSFGDQRFDYMLMPKAFTKKEPGTAAEQKEVAKLCYSCGVAVNMQYGLDGSGTNSYFINEALISHFGYNSLTTPIQRSGYSYDEWDPIIRGELQAGRPVIYSGNSGKEKGSGHAFVLEGYDKEGLYYVNWGWGGTYDGYYDLSILNPEGVSTGASIMPDGFCENQVAVVNISPKEGEGTYRTPLFGAANSKFTASKSSCQLGNTITFKADTPYNYSGTMQNGECGVVLIQDGKEVDRMACFSVDLEGMTQDYRIEGCQIEARYPIPTNLKEGTYRLYFYFKPIDLNQYDYIRFARSEYESYMELNVKGKEVTIRRPSVDLQMQAAHWSFDSQPVSTHPEQFSVDITNLSGQTVAGEFLLSLYAPGSNKGVTIESLEPCYTLKPGEPERIDFMYNFDKAGDWTCELSFRPWNTAVNTFSPVIEGKRTFNVNVDERAGARFKLNAAPVITSLSDDGLFYRNSPIHAVLNVTNSGTNYKGQFALHVFTKTSNPDSQTPTDIIIADAECTADGVAHDVIIDGTLNLSITRNTSLYVRGYYYDGSDWVLLDEGLYTKINVYGEDAPSGIEQVEAEHDASPIVPWHDCEIFNILGKRISLPADGQLPKGIYIINGKKTIIK